jgi:DNA-binding NarL/FixJ family response regulator
MFLTELISDDDALELVGAVGRADEAVALAVAKRPDVALVDVRMPGDGVTAAEGIRNRAPGTRVIALSAHNDRTTVLEMLEAGAVGYLVKDASVQTIIESIRRAAEGQGSLAGAVTAGVIDELVEQRRQAPGGGASPGERRLDPARDRSAGSLRHRAPADLLAAGRRRGRGGGAVAVLAAAARWPSCRGFRSRCSCPWCETRDALEQMWLATSRA